MADKTIKHVVWDWNGTLFDDAQACVETLNIILKKRSLPSVTLEEYRKVFKFPVKEYYELLGFDFSVEDWDGMAREFYGIYENKASIMSLRAGIIDVLRSLRVSGMPMSVLSASETNFLEKALAEKGVREFFEGVYGLSDIYAGSKHDAGMRLISDLRVSAGSILLIGDTTHDYEVARGLGCQCLLITGGHQAEDRLRQCACRIISDVGMMLETGYFQYSNA